MVQWLYDFGFKFDLVLADSEYGESGSSFVSLLHHLRLALRARYPV